MNKLHNKGSRNMTLCHSERSSLGGGVDDMDALRQEGEQLLLDYRAQYANDIFDKNILRTFENMFEAGYLFKYFSVVWQEFQHESEDGSSKILTENQSYKERKKSFRLSSVNTPT